jgi:hypothetical protein
MDFFPVESALSEFPFRPDDDYLNAVTYREFCRNCGVRFASNRPVNGAAKHRLSRNVWSASGLPALWLRRRLMLVREKAGASSTQSKRFARFDKPSLSERLTSSCDVLVCRAATNFF